MGAPEISAAAGVPRNTARAENCRKNFPAPLPRYLRRRRRRRNLY